MNDPSGCLVESVFREHKLRYGESTSRQTEEQTEPEVSHTETSGVFRLEQNLEPPDDHCWIQLDFHWKNQL